MGKYNSFDGMSMNKKYIKYNNYKRTFMYVVLGFCCDKFACNSYVSDGYEKSIERILLEELRGDDQKTNN